MSGAIGKGPGRRPPAKKDLRAQADAQILELLKLASKSDNPAFVAATVQIANDRQRQQHKAEAKLSPGVAVTLATLVALAVVCGCWYALLEHPGRMGFALASITCSVGILVVTLYALFSGHLSQTNFMVIFRWATDSLKRLWPFGNKGPKSED